MIVRFTATGRRQFLEALSYIHRERSEAARAFRDRSEASLSRLSAFPELGRSLPEFPDLPFRELILSPYRFFYRIEDETGGRAPACSRWHVTTLVSIQTVSVSELKAHLSRYLRDVRRGGEVQILGWSSHIVEALTADRDGRRSGTGTPRRSSRPR